MMIALALATALSAPTFVPVASGGDPAPDPSVPDPDPPPVEPDPVQTEAPPPPVVTEAPPPVVQSAPPPPVVQSTAPPPVQTKQKPKKKKKKRVQPIEHAVEPGQGALMPKWRRSRDGANEAFTVAQVAPTAATAEPQLALLPVADARSSSAMFLLAALTAALAAMLLAAVPAYALWRTWVFRPLVHHRFELGVAGVSILAGIVFAKGLLGT